MSFQFYALDDNQFAHLFKLDDAELAKHGAMRIVVDACPGTPCRVSLEDAPVGETVILANFEHMAKTSPFRSSHAIFVRQGVARAQPEPGQVPELLRHRVLSIRAFDGAGMMKFADLVDGSDVETLIEQMFKDPEIEELHVHYAKPGCFAARVSRVEFL